MILELFKSGMILAELSNEYGISKSTSNYLIMLVIRLKLNIAI